MLVAAALSFAGGIYLNALYHVSLTYTIIPLVFFLSLIPFLIRRGNPVPGLLILICFALTGMVRIGMVGINQTVEPSVKGVNELYQGFVTESSPKTKILQLTSPKTTSGIKTVLRTPQDLNINDGVRVFGELRDIDPTFNNPHLLSWKWMKRLEGVSHELRGTIISTTPGTHYVHLIRNLAKEKIEASGARHGDIIKAITIGDTTGLQEETKKLFMRTGTSHILAISGFHVGIVTGFLFFVLRFIIGRIRRISLRGDDTRYAALLTIPCIFMFMFLAGARIPTMRATIMITVFMLSLFFERGRNVFNTLAVSGLIILLIYPHSIFTPSFQLTYASVVFILLLGQRVLSFVKVSNRLIKGVLLSAGVTVSAMVGTFPVVLYHFYGINPFSVIHNLTCVPLMGLVAMPLSLAGIVLPWGEHILRLSGEVFAAALRILSLLDWGYIYPMVRPNLFEIALYFIFLVSMLTLRKRLAFALIIFLLLPLASGYGYHAWNERFSRDLRVSFLDVGNGDAMLRGYPIKTCLYPAFLQFLQAFQDRWKSFLSPTKDAFSWA